MDIIKHTSSLYIMDAMMNKIDLHTHTTASDGIYSPIDLINLAQKKKVSALAITDHDTIGGLDEGMTYARSIGFNLIPGIEFSLDYERGSFHLLGLYIDYKNKELIKILQNLNHLRETRAKRIVDDLQKHDIKITLKDIEREAAGGTIGRPHVARAMVRKGYAKNMMKVFDKFLVKGKPGYVKKDKISIEDAISVIKKSNGIPVIAHPISLNFKKFKVFEEIIKDFILKGIEGIEVYASMHSASEIEKFKEIAETNNLIMTGGSDFHGDKKEVIGNYSPRKRIPVELYSQLEKYYSLPKK